MVKFVSLLYIFDYTKWLRHPRWLFLPPLRRLAVKQHTSLPGVSVPLRPLSLSVAVSVVGIDVFLIRSQSGVGINNARDGERVTDRVSSNREEQRAAFFLSWLREVERMMS